MKTQPLRKEKNCLNCGTEVPERYCTHCGQENTVQHETFGHLVGHFVADIFHYDSQFLTTLKALIIKPGFLTREYMAGRRVRYVNPIKLYVFVSFVFFFGVLALNSSHKEENGEDEIAEETLLNTGIGKDTIRLAAGTAGLKKAFENDSSATGRRIEELATSMNEVKSAREFDSLQQALPDSQRLNGVARKLMRRMVEVQHKYGKDTQAVIVEMFQHNLPKLMFILLPLFALFMKWMYHRKKWLYADHAIFAIHLHTFAFIIGLLASILTAIFHKGIFLTVCYWSIFIYLVLALRNNYHQSLVKSLFKGIFLLGIYLLSAGIVFLGFLVLIFGIFL
ncbi:uncharacterized protein DUF3667 [Chitinophaga polysaccharea]|uniref:Uncharacterized protein DUF3667 n=1 Tax=Chitinophaga polysaccharea TaxID=1293035 RepID=A0A561PC24_9BACT|nr:DUF3667 domain-containing protein [Chitinophaga polysaccharea]TWF35683.1 uncharacterized protein DUF3667 [Chitinophaga polysaccharea]